MSVNSLDLSSSSTRMPSIASCRSIRDALSATRDAGKRGTYGRWKDRRNVSRKHVSADREVSAKKRGENTFIPERFALACKNFLRKRPFGMVNSLKFPAPTELSSVAIPRENSCPRCRVSKETVEHGEFARKKYAIQRCVGASGRRIFA